MSLLGDIILNYYAGATSYADQAVVAAVEELEKHADRHPGLVARVELAIMKAGSVSIPYAKSDEVGEWLQLMRETA